MFQIPNDARSKDIVRSVRRIYGPEAEIRIPGAKHKFFRGAPNNLANILGVDYPLQEQGQWRLSKEDLAWAKPEQIAAVRMFCRNPGLIVSHPTGCGKTFTSIAAVAAAGVSRVTLVTPSRVIRNFKKTLAKHAPRIAYTVLEGQTPAPPEEWRWVGPSDSPAKIAIVSWANLPHWTSTFYESWANDNCALVLDEAHRAKSSTRWHAVEDATGKATFFYNDSWAGCCALLSRAHQKRLLLSATPQSTDRSDWWAQLDYAEPDAWATYRPFTAEYCGGAAGKYGWDAGGATQTEEFVARMNLVQHHVEKKTMPLPRVRIHFERIPAAQLDLRSGQKSLPRKIPGRDALRQEILIAYAAAAKRPWLLDRVPQWCAQGLRTTIFTNRKEEVIRVELALKSLVPGGTEIYAVNGNSKDADIDRALERYCDTETSNPAVLISTLDLLGEGVDGLHKVTQNAVFLAIPPTPRQIVQGVGRFHRLEGIEADVWILFGEGLIDEGIVDILGSRLQDFNTLLAGDSTIEELSEKMSDESGGMTKIRAKLLQQYGGIL